MTHSTGSLITPDGLTLFTRAWTPDRPSRLTVLLVHGLHEHSGRYAFPASHLMRRGITVRAFDLRGHGKSGGERSFVESFDDYLDDLREVIGAVHQDLGDEEPLVLMGHSLGGLIAAAYVVREGTQSLDGLVLSSPALNVPGTTSPLLRRIGGVVSRYVPRLRVTRVDLSKLSHDPHVEQAYRADPLCDTRGVRARVAAGILDATAMVRAHPEAFTLPLYLFHGTADKTTDPAGSRRLAKVAPSETITLRLYPGLFHETLNETERETVLQDLSDWLVARAPVGTT